jgi:hypothetical protein
MVTNVSMACCLGLRFAKGGFTVVGASGAFKMWRPLRVTTNLGYDSFLFLT